MNEKFRSGISHSSDDTVKVVYAWHGPRSALPNAEPPNILTLASAVAGVEHIAIDSNVDTAGVNYPIENGWYKLFSKDKEHYELCTVASIIAARSEPLPCQPFIVPFQFNYMKELNMKFDPCNGVLERSAISDSDDKNFILLPELRTENGYIVIDHMLEAYMDDYLFLRMYNYFHEIHKLPMYKIIYLVGSPNAQQIYDDWATRYNLPNDREHRMTLISAFPGQLSFHQQYDQYEDNNDQAAADGFHLVPEYDENYLPEKLFLTWNRRYKLHRTLLALILEELNLIDKTTISFPRESDENTLDTFELRMPKIKEMVQNIDIDISNETIERFNQRLPLTIDGETYNQARCYDHVGSTRQYYTNTLVSLVTETNYRVNKDQPDGPVYLHKHTVEHLTLTEKSFKPMFNKHPIIMVGGTGALQILRDMGFKTFSDFWDESYDLIEDSLERLKQIKVQIEKIASWDDQQILEFKRKVKPIIDHNYHNFKCSSMDKINTSIYNHITDNFNHLTKVSDHV